MANKRNRRLLPSVRSRRRYPDYPSYYGRNPQTYGMPLYGLGQDEGSTTAPEPVYVESGPIAAPAEVETPPVVVVEETEPTTPLKSLLDWYRDWYVPAPLAQTAYSLVPAGIVAGLACTLLAKRLTDANAISVKGSQLLLACIAAGIPTIAAVYLIHTFKTYRD